MGTKSDELPKCLKRRIYTLKFDKLFDKQGKISRLSQHRAFCCHLAEWELDKVLESCKHDRARKAEM